MKRTDFPWARFLPAPPGNRVQRAFFCNCASCRSGEWPQGVAVRVAGDPRSRIVFAVRWCNTITCALYPYRYTH